jgi:hypothetical protein
MERAAQAISKDPQLRQTINSINAEINQLDAIVDAFEAAYRRTMNPRPASAPTPDGGMAKMPAPETLEAALEWLHRRVVRLVQRAGEVSQRFDEAV